MGERFDRPTPRFEIPPDETERTVVIEVRSAPASSSQIIRSYQHTISHIPGRIWLISIALFLTTCVSVFYAGGTLFSIEGQFNTIHGLQFMAGLIGVLLAHEMGHFLFSLYYHVPATPPMFIPMPLISPFGTMGALIIQQAGRADRKSQFDIGIAGPLAGLVVLLPLFWFSLQGASISPATIPPSPDGQPREVYLFNCPPLMNWMISLHYPEYTPDMDVEWSPLIFACWTGFLITALNLIPIGQLDGGHIVYGLLGTKAHYVSYGLVFLAVGYMIGSANYAFMLMLFVISWVGIKHPPTANDRVPLGTLRIVLGWLTIALLLVIFTPNPVSIEMR